MTTMKTLDANQITRYIDLVDRRLYILMHSGIDWQPEYAAELEAIDKEIAELRKVIDYTHECRKNHSISVQG